MFNRAITEFTGNCVIVGCGRNHSRCDYSLHPNSKDYYTINIDNTCNPDYVFDLTSSNLPTALNQRFFVTLTEHLPYYAYNTYETGFMPRNNGESQFDGHLGFNNLMTLTKPEGFILICGSAPNKEFRKSLYPDGSNPIKYIELHHLLLLIPKNQNWDIETIKQTVKQNIFLQDLITKAALKNQVNSVPINDWTFCPILYKDLKTFREDIACWRSRSNKKSNSPPYFLEPAFHSASQASSQPVSWFKHYFDPDKHPIRFIIITLGLGLFYYLFRAIYRAIIYCCSLSSKKDQHVPTNNLSSTGQIAQQADILLMDPTLRGAYPEHAKDLASNSSSATLIHPDTETKQSPALRSPLIQSR